MLSQVCLNFSRFSDSEILANEELQELEAAEKMPVIFDEDCPEMTEKCYNNFTAWTVLL